MLPLSGAWLSLLIIVVVTFDVGRGCSMETLPCLGSGFSVSGELRGMVLGYH